METQKIEHRYETLAVVNAAALSYRQCGLAFQGDRMNATHVVCALWKVQASLKRESEWAKDQMTRQLTHSTSRAARHHALFAYFSPETPAQPAVRANVCLCVLSELRRTTQRWCFPLKRGCV
jgi:hypothetical protein